jgi:hypothetical protein
VSIFNPTAATESSVTISVVPVTVNANTTGDQSLSSSTITAGLLNSVGKTLRLFAAGVYSTPVASTATITIKVKLGSVTLFSATSSANPGTVTNNSWNANVYVTTQTAGVSAVFECHGNMVIDLGASPGLPDSTFSDTNIAVSSAVDSTASQTMQVTVAFSAASGSNSCTQRQWLIEAVN